MTDQLRALVALDADVDRGVIEALLSVESLRVIRYVDLESSQPADAAAAAGDVLFVACADYTAHIGEYLSTAARQHPLRPVVLITPIGSNGYVNKAFEAGADDIVALPADSSPDAARALSKYALFAVEKSLARKRGSSATAVQHGRMICVLGLKGGSGKTLTAVNLAVALADAGHRVTVVDLDLQFGDVGLALGLNPTSTVYDLIRSGGSLDAEKLEDFLVEHPSGVRALLAPSRPDQAAAVTPDDLREIYALLRELSDFVVIDTPPGFTPQVIGAVDASTDLCMVAMLDSLSLKNAKLGMETLEQMGYDSDDVRLVLNRADSKVGIGREDVSAIMGASPEVLIPSDRTVTRSINEGEPVVLEHRRSEAARAFRTLATLYVRDGAAEAPAAPSRRRWVCGGRVRESSWNCTNESPLKTAAPEVSSELADPFAEVKNRIHRGLIEDLGRQIFNQDIDPETLRSSVRAEVEQRLREETGISREDREQLATALTDDILGHGPLERLLTDDTVTEIMVNGPHDVWLERDGHLHPTAVRFTDEDQLRRIISKMAAEVGRRIDESSPMVDARMPDGSRINAVIPPLSLSGPLLTIRKFGRERLSLADLIRVGTLTPDTGELLERCVQARLNILISGGAGAGKTTLLNALSASIPDSERIITIEDAAELKLVQRHVLRLECRPKNIEDEGEVTIRDLVRNSLRMRPDRIVVGEVRGAEALDMLQALNTGHDGSLTTLHANSARDALARVETMVLMAGYDLPLRAIRQQVTSALDLVIHLERMYDGSRKVITITEVQRMESEVITLQDLFHFQVGSVENGRTVVGGLEGTGLRPHFLEKFRRRGVELPAAIVPGGPTQPVLATARGDQ